jgi:hypothetical protein
MRCLQAELHLVHVVMIIFLIVGYDHSWSCCGARAAVEEALAKQLKRGYKLSTNPEPGTVTYSSPHGFSLLPVHTSTVHTAEKNLLSFCYLWTLFASELKRFNYFSSKIMNM